jgi:hypothetical protein
MDRWYVRQASLRKLRRGSLHACYQEHIIRACKRMEFTRRCRTEEAQEGTTGRRSWIYSPQLHGTPNALDHSSGRSVVDNTSRLQTAKCLVRDTESRTGRGWGRSRWVASTVWMFASRRVSGTDALSTHAQTGGDCNKNMAPQASRHVAAGKEEAGVQQ